MSLDTVERIYPNTFFNISHPDAPLVSIQFRTNMKTSLTDAESWENVVFNPSNFFDSVSIEDAGGMQRIELNIIDKNFANAEDVIIRSMLATREANNLSENEEMTAGDWSMTFDNTSMVNMRIRFGYAEAGPTANTVINTTSLEDNEWTGRINSGNTVLKSPWLYMQMLDSKFNVNENGLTVTLSAFTIIDTFLNRAKLIRKFAILRGKPKDLITDLDIMLGDVTNNKLIITAEDEPDEPTTADDDGIIEVSLGTRINQTERGWKSLKSILTEVASKVPPRVYDKNDSLKDPNSDEGLKQAKKIVPYSYYVIQNDNGTVEIRFYYPSPTGDKQTKIRTYLWSNYGNSIVRNLDITSSMDFANLNRQVLGMDPKTGEIEIYGAVANKAADESEEDNASSNKLVNLSNVTEAINNPEFKYGFVSDAYSSDSGIANDNTVGARIAKTVISYLNESVFSGSLEIPGDPYYLFDTKLRPYEHAIRIMVNRPAYIDESGSYVSNKVSYLSGHYLVKKITHRIDGSGFGTTLEIMRWPIEKSASI